MAVGDHVAAGEVTDEPLVPSCGAAGVVNETDSQTLSLDDPPPRQLSAEPRLVHVSVHRSDRSEGGELLEDG